jgi:hypothetical protein
LLVLLLLLLLLVVLLLLPLLLVLIYIMIPGTGLPNTHRYFAPTAGHGTYNRTDTDKRRRIVSIFAGVSSPCFPLEQCGLWETSIVPEA